jgi:hypothetical protein
MARKGRGIFMVDVDIDAQDVQEFNEWYKKEHLPELLSVPAFSQRPATRQSRVARSTWHAMNWKAWR